MCNHYDEVIRNVEQQSPCAGVQEAYMAAAPRHAWHPNPDEQTTQAGSSSITKKKWEVIHCILLKICIFSYNEKNINYKVL
jgi:hypothetical protein